MKAGERQHVLRCAEGAQAHRNRDEIETAPKIALDQLGVGDQIVIQTAHGVYIYLVTDTAKHLGMVVGGVFGNYAAEARPGSIASCGRGSLQSRRSRALLCQIERGMQARDHLSHYRHCSSAGSNGDVALTNKKTLSTMRRRQNETEFHE
jgi:hypothetical protein